MIMSMEAGEFGSAVALVLWTLAGMLSMVMVLGRPRLGEGPRRARRTGGQAQRCEEGWGTAAAWLVALPGDREASSQALHRRLQGPAPGQSGAARLHDPAEVALGLLCIAHAAPEAALHESNVLLLIKLRHLAGARGFARVCRRLATSMAHTDRPPIAERMARGDLTWLEFLGLIRETVDDEALAVPSACNRG